MPLDKFTLSVFCCSIKDQDAASYNELMKQEPEIKRGDKVEVRITSLAPGGEGVSKDFGMPIFVNRVAEGDRALIEIFDRRSNFARGRVLEILAPSPDRAEPPCKLFKVCGGCQWQHISYEGQLKAKEQIIKQALNHIGGLDAASVKEVIPSGKQLFYRNKVQFPVRQPKGSDRILAGYYEQDSHNLVNVKHCPIQPKALDEMLEAAKASCEQFRVSAYNEITGEGLLRFINARYSEENEQILVTLVVNCAKTKIPDYLKQAALDIAEKLSSVVGVCLNFNTKPGNRILGEETVCITGKPYLEETLKTKRTDYPEELKTGLTFRLSSSSFFQVNTEQAVNIFECLSDFILDFSSVAKVAPAEMVVLDAYAGVGAIALWLSPFVKKVLAVEEVADAVKDGHVNLELNRIENVDFRLGKVEQVLPKLFNEGVRPHVVIVDPPRRGCSEKALEAVLAFAPPLILYVSCNPVTLARDLKLIIGDGESKCGYKTVEIQPVDLFPQTYHIESIAVLQRQPQYG
ncbi:MAG: 23S rRNA (uracil(1939)-C(5))-methyltransferase RlmD [Candidatus Melainabacteria bacterium]|nr:MAG: 23S rRNA (uracil(1939)-C(5))-methyltransferase RlmD [Candidatus Melainabacteria bacterium]